MAADNLAPSVTKSLAPWCWLCRTKGPLCFMKNDIISCAISVLRNDKKCKYIINTLRPRWNEQHFADDIFKHIFWNENVWISIKISPKFVPKGPINNIPSLVQIMAWRRPGDKPLSKPMMARLSTHICVTRPQWVKMSKLSPRVKLLAYLEQACRV